MVSYLVLLSVEVAESDFVLILIVMDNGLLQLILLSVEVAESES